MLANNYNPLPVTITKGEGVWVYDDKNNKYLDMLSAYSALNFGHLHPRIVRALQEQLSKLGVFSRVFGTDNLETFAHDLIKLTNCKRLTKVLPMNTGAEAVESALKLARKWGYVNNIHKPEVIWCNNNFHGRTIHIVGGSTTRQYKEGFGPYDTSYRHIPFDSVAALKSAITPNTVAFLCEPIQGEGGINVPSPGYFKEVREICDKENVLLILDEVQTGFGRTGADFAFQFEGIEPDILILGKGLGGGLYPISAVLASDEVMDVFCPGDHGSTFGGNPLGCAVAIEAMKVLTEEALSWNAATMGVYFKQELNSLKNPHIIEVRGRGLMVGLEIDCDGRWFCERMLQEGVLCKETHDTVIRLAPPLIIEKAQVDFTLEKIEKVLNQIRQAPYRKCVIDI